jgi:hypothetical protein
MKIRGRYTSRNNRVFLRDSLLERTGIFEDKYQRRNKILRADSFSQDRCFKERVRL